MQHFTLGEHCVGSANHPFHGFEELKYGKGLLDAELWEYRHVLVAIAPSDSGGF
jgi:hypothetical protein